MQRLQQIVFSPATEIGSVASGEVRCEGDRLIGKAGGHVIFDGIFGAFFEGYWRRWTGVVDLALDFRLDGHVELEVVRFDSITGQSRRIVQQEQQAAGQRVVVPIPLADAGETRLALSVRFVSDTVISALAWSTTTKPARAVDLIAVICTFNRDADVGRTLRTLLGLEAALKRIIIVNQGTPGLADRLAMDGLESASDRVVIIDQVNLGGAGGFGRGILEGWEDDECSHLLLMDDDIELDASVVNRLLVILSYLTSDAGIGGAMLDREDRRTLFSVGDILHAQKPEILNLVDPAANDIAADQTTRYLARYHTPDFNGWWFFAFPKSAIGQVGLPLPLFIRGDDVEYGYRLSRSGVRTLGWPGLAVWHEPFHKKRHAWHYFYDRRNSLFLCEMHGRLGRFRLWRSLMIGFLAHLLRYDYDRAYAIMLGLRAFNDGAGRLVQWSGEDHRRLIDRFKIEEGTLEGSEVPGLPSQSRLPAAMLFAVRLIYDLAAPSPREAEPFIPIDSRAWKPSVRSRPRRVRVCFVKSGTAAELSHDARRARACCIQFLREWFRFLFRRWRPSRLVSLTMPSFWHAYTGRADHVLNRYGRI